MKKLFAVLVIIVFAVTSVYAKPKKRGRQVKPKKKVSSMTGYKIGIAGGPGMSIAYQPEYKNKSAFWLIMQENKPAVGGMALIDNYYYFIDFAGVNLAAGFHSVQSKWKGTDELNVSRSYTYTGYYVGARVGPAFQYSNFFLNADFQFLYRVKDSKKIDSTDYNTLGATSMPLGAAVNVGYRLSLGPIKIPMGIEYMYLHKIHTDPSGYKVVNHSINLYTGVLF